MNAQEILHDQIQLDFCTDLLSALSLGGGINDQLSSELGKLSNKKSYLVEQLKKLWEDRGSVGFFPPSKVIELNLELYVKL